VTVDIMCTSRVEEERGGEMARDDNVCAFFSREGDLVP
jgi:hypothetical protein